MSHAGNGRPVVYKISFAGNLAHELKTLTDLAKAVGLGNACLDALRIAVFRMRNDPWGFGELVYRLKKAEWSIHVRVVKPLAFEFAICEKNLSCTSNVFSF